VNVLDHTALQRHAADIVAAQGSIDVCFNATSNDDIQGSTVLDMRFEELMQPVTKSLTAHFNIATSVARHMARSGRGGVILVMAGGREAIPRLGGAHVAWAALAGLSRQLAADLGPHGSASRGCSRQAHPASLPKAAQLPNPLTSPSPSRLQAPKDSSPDTSPPTRK
jgi:3-oxoacyl-[acyl-carrier protein] reductase